MESYALSSPNSPPWAPNAVDSQTFSGANIWPKTPPQFRETFERYFDAVETLADQLMRMFALALRVEQDYFRDFFSPYQGVVRANYYGKLDQQPLPGQLRIGAHADLGGFTVLSADEGCGGLQIQDITGKWHDVNSPPDGFVINIGEFMQAWTNDRWRATRHRVLAPRSAAENTDRLTIPFFFNPDPDRYIECIPTCLDPGATPRHERFKVGDFRQHRLAQQQAVA
jgi:isopenicillin N synthase-like dioxygenase